MPISSPLINSVNNDRFIEVSLKRKRGRPISLKVKARGTTSMRKFLKPKGIEGVREEIDRVKISLWIIGLESNTPLSFSL